MPPGSLQLDRGSSSGICLQVTPTFAYSREPTVLALVPHLRQVPQTRRRFSDQTAPRMYASALDSVSLSLYDDWPTACNVYGHVANHDASSERFRNRRSRGKIGRSMGARISARRSRGESRSPSNHRFAGSLLCRFKGRRGFANPESRGCEVSL